MRVIKLLKLIVIVATLNFFTNSTFAAIEMPFSAESSNLVEFTEETKVTNDPNSNSSTQGHKKIGAAMEKIINIIQAVIGGIATLLIIISAVMIIIADEEEKISNGKKGVGAGFLGLMFMLTIDTIILDIFYGGRSFEAGSMMSNQETMQSSLKAGNELVMSVLEWSQSIIIILAILYLMISGISMITALGESEEINKKRQVIQWVGLGVIVIMLNEIIVKQIIYNYIFQGDEIIYQPDASRGIVEIVGLIKYALQFLAIVVFIILVYGGGQMVFSFGNDEAISKGKSVISASIIGIIIILISYTMIATFTSGTI